MKIRSLFVLIFMILASCALPRYKKQPDGVRMVHYHTGSEYRGVNLWEWFFKFKNPRYGQGYDVLVKDPAAIYGKNKNRYTTKVKDRRTYVKPPTEEQWEKILNPDLPASGLVDSTEIKKSTQNVTQEEPKKKSAKSKSAIDSESSISEEKKEDTEKKK